MPTGRQFPQDDKARRLRVERQRALDKAAERKDRGLTGFTRRNRESEIKEAQSGASDFVRQSARGQRKKR